MDRTNDVDMRSASFFFIPDSPGYFSALEYKPVICKDTNGNEKN